MMKLFTKPIIDKLKKAADNNQDGYGMDKKIIAKFFNPYGAGTWLITTAEYVYDENGNVDPSDMYLYGYCSLGYGYEYGPVMKSEIENTTIDLFGCKLHLERDLYLGNKKIGEVISEEDLM